jgi:hypothetical protein
MEEKQHRLVGAQIFISIFIWVLLFSAPVLFGSFEVGINWGRIFRIWEEYAIILVIFILNHFLYLPKLFFRGRRYLYILSLVLTIFISTYIVYVVNHKDGVQKFPLEHKIRPEQPNHAGSPSIVKQPGPNELIPPFANMLVLSFLLIGFDTGLVFSVKWMQSEQNKLKAEKESIKNKMAFLQNQISPHFFMNTLNNIHVLVDMDTNEAKNAIIKLSQMMDYMLYESQVDKISLKKEIDFIVSYIALMKLRITDDVNIKLNIPEYLPQIQIPPLLMISFIENAFKYGISYEAPSFIDIEFNITEKHFLFRISNSLHLNIDKKKKSGIGIENTRNRLNLIYGNNYTLGIVNKYDKFEVILNFPV